MLKLFHGLLHGKKKEEVQPERVVIHDQYETYRMMTPENLEREAQNKEAEANQLVVKWNGLTDSEKDENMDIYYKCLNLRKEANFFRELKNNFNAKIPEFFRPMSLKEARKLQPYIWEPHTGKLWDK